MNKIKVELQYSVRFQDHQLVSKQDAKNGDVQPQYPSGALWFPFPPMNFSPMGIFRPLCIVVLYIYIYICIHIRICIRIRIRHLYLRLSISIWFLAGTSRSEERGPAGSLRGWGGWLMLMTQNKHTQPGILLKQELNFMTSASHLYKFRT